MPISTSIIAIPLITVLLIVSVPIFRSCKPQVKSGPSIAPHVQEAKQDLSSATKTASKAVSIVQNRPPLNTLPSVQVNTILTSETLTLLQTREAEDLTAISTLQTVIDKTDNVIKWQDIQIRKLEHKVILWKVISGVIVIIAILIIV
jgi:hypothetical protein